MIKKNSIFILFLCGGLHLLPAQNLIPNGDVSRHDHPNCPFLPFEGMSRLKDWYSLESSTVDYYVSGCPYLPVPGLAFNPFFHYNGGGQGFLGFWGIFKTNHTMVSEVFATPLMEPLKNDFAYWLSVDIRSRGIGHPVEGIRPLYCPSDPKMQFDVYTNAGVIRGELDGNGGATKVNANKVLSLDIIPVVDTLTSETWINFTGCFQAIGGETHIGFGMTIDSFLPVSPCDAPFDPSDFNSWVSYLYFNADNFQLLPIPLHIQDTLLLCKEKGEVKLSVEDYLGGVNLSDIQAYWDDGFVGTVRTFTTRGNHYLRLNHQCGHTDFEIFADEKRCKTEPFIPNVFSPNGDGINDFLYPFISSDFPIANYEFMIFDRWGNQLFKSTSNDPSAGWNGRFKGKDAAPGMYVWSLKFDVTMPAGVQQNQLSGEVLLIRY